MIFTVAVLVIFANLWKKLKSWIKKQIKYVLLSVGFLWMQNVQKKTGPSTGTVRSVFISWQDQGEIECVIFILGKTQAILV